MKQYNLPKKWPVEEGRYQVGNLQSPVAVCTEATISGIKVDLQKVAIVGKCVTENVGIEKLVKNMISNPNIRFLIVCGRQSAGHNVGQTLLALNKNGIDKNNRVVGSNGSIPVLRHLTVKEVKRFQDQTAVLDLRGELDSAKIGMKVDWCWKNDPGAFTGKPLKIKMVKQEKVPKIVAPLASDDYLPDPQGSFLITINKEKGLIIVQHFDTDLEQNLEIVGKKARDIADVIIKKSLIGDFSQGLDHAAYLGRELAKAEVCLKNSIDYIQDEEIVFKKNKKSLAEDDFGW